MSSYICLASRNDLIKILSAACTLLRHTWAASTILFFPWFWRSPPGSGVCPVCTHLSKAHHVYFQPFFLTANGAGLCRAGQSWRWQTRLPASWDVPREHSWILFVCRTRLRNGRRPKSRARGETRCNSTTYPSRACLDFLAEIIFPW